MLKLAALALAALLPLVQPTGHLAGTPAGSPADSVEYKITWPAAVSPYGPVTRYKVVIVQGTVTWTHDSVGGLADSVNAIKPGFGGTVYPFTATVTPFYAGAAGSPLSVTWTYSRPSPAPSFPAGAEITVDSSKIVRP